LISNDLTHEFEHQTNLDLLHERQPLCENYGPYNGEEPGRKAEQLLKGVEKNWMEKRAAHPL